MPARITQASFTRGELTPKLDARNNLEQYSIGLKIAKNAIIHQEGGISNRMGLEYCESVKYPDKKTRLMKFVFNMEQTYMIELGEYYIRILTKGAYVRYPSDHEKAGQVVEISSPYKEEDLFQLKRSQSGDLLTITHQNYEPKNLTRYDHHDWRLESIIFEPKITAPVNVRANWFGDTSSNVKTYQYLVTAVEDETNEESERSEIVSVVGHREANWLTTEYMSIAWSAVEGACEYNIYRNVNGVYGYVGTAEGTSFVDDCIEPDLTSCAPVSRNPFMDNNNPSCSCYYQQRKMYANSNNNPQTLWSSQTGTPNNFNVSRPLIATNAVTITLDDREMNEIRHLIPMSDLIVLTSNSEFKVNGTDSIFQANPAPAAVIQSCYGASHVEPVISGSMVIFVQSGGSVIRDLGYEYMSDSYDGEELSIFSNHLFEGKQVISMAYAKEPYRLLWVIFDDGTCACMTYNKKQKLCGWTRIETDGLFESVDVVREGLEDVAYFVVKRKINDNDVRYIERTRTRIIDSAKGAFLVDCGLSNEFSTPRAVISGLSHLEGKEVIVNADGGIVTGLVVQNGTISLPNAARNIVVGLAYEFEIETLNFEGENTQGLKKVINYASVKIYKSREDFIFVGADGSEFRVSRSKNSIDYPKNLYSKDVAQTLFSMPETDATVHIKQDYPLPLTILSISAAIDVQDNENN